MMSHEGKPTKNKWSRVAAKLAKAEERLARMSDNRWLDGEWPEAVSDGLVTPCTDCGELPRFDYCVEDEFWNEWGDGPNVLCLPCLDTRCQGRGLGQALVEVQWTGTEHTVVLRPEYVHEYQDNNPEASDDE